MYLKTWDGVGRKERKRNRTSSSCYRTTQLHGAAFGHPSKPLQTPASLWTARSLTSTSPCVPGADQEHQAGGATGNAVPDLLCPIPETDASIPRYMEESLSIHSLQQSLACTHFHYELHYLKINRNPEAQGKKPPLAVLRVIFFFKCVKSLCEMFIIRAAEEGKGAFWSLLPLLRYIPSHPETAGLDQVTSTGSAHPVYANVHANTISTLLLICPTKSHTKHQLIWDVFKRFGFFVCQQLFQTCSYHYYTHCLHQQV